MHVAETARHQGLDLYAEGRQRLVSAMEFHAAFELGAPAPSWLCGGSLRKGLGPMPEMVYNHYVNRAGAAMAQTKRLIQRARPTGTSYFIGWETLTHAQNP